MWFSQGRVTYSRKCGISTGYSPAHTLSGKENHQLLSRKCNSFNVINEVNFDWEEGVGVGGSDRWRGLFSPLQ